MGTGVKSFSKNCLLACMMVLLCLVPAADAQEQSSDSHDQRVMTEAQRRLRTNVSYKCRDMSIDLVLDQLSDQADIDIIKSPKVVGNVTVKVTDVPLDEALKIILEVHGWTYIPSENMIKVIPIDEVEVATTRFGTQIYRITYADVDEVATALKDFIKDQGSVAVNKGTSNIIVTAHENTIKSIDQFIEEIDRITPQVLVEVRIYDITAEDTFILQQAWVAMRNTPLTEVAHSEETINSTTTSPIEETVEIVDGVPIVTQSVGGTVDSTSVVDTTTKSDFPLFKSKPFGLGAYDPTSGGLFNFSIFNDAVAIDILLNILQQEVGAALLANPRILVLDNQMATFQIVSEIPYIERSQTSQGGNMTSVTFKEVGVDLKVTPHIAREGMIRLHIEPEFGVVTGQVEIIGTEDTLAPPIIDTRRANTIALVKDGQTIAIGGLRKKERREIVSKVPILADIPLLGDLFKSRFEVEETVELVVFVTASIVTEPMLSDVEAAQLATTDFPGPGLPK